MSASQTYQYEWSQALARIDHQKMLAQLSVSVLPGQRAKVKQWQGQFGDLEVFNKVEYATESCLGRDNVTHEAVAKETLLKERENCSPDSPELKVKVMYNQGIVVNKYTWHLSEKPLAVAPDLIQRLQEAVGISTQLGQWKSYWQSINFQVYN
jgi:hypothetical protein